MTSLLPDARFALRLFKRTPGFAALAVLTLAIGIGANTAIFSVTNAVLLRKLAYRDPDRLVLIDARRPSENVKQGPLSWVRFEQVRDRNRSFDGIAAATADAFNLTGIGEPEQLQAGRVSWNFFRILGVEACAGRTFLPEEDRPGSAPVAILSDSLWQRRFARRANAIGVTLMLDGRPHTIVGVAPPGFQFPAIGTTLDVFTTHPDQLNGVSAQMVQSGVGYLVYIARLKPGVAMPAAQAEMDALATAWRRENPKMPDTDPSLIVHAGNLQDETVSSVRAGVLMLFGAVSLVLLIACANVASLLLSRAIGRKREMAVRAAIGATRAAIVRQLLVESVMVSAAAGVLGTLFSLWGTQALAQLAATTLPRGSEIALDGRVLAFTAIISIVSGLVFGLIPALQVSRPDLNTILRTASPGRQHGGMRALLVVSQVALSTVLLIGSGLLLRNFLQLRLSSPGFDARNLLTLSISLPQARYAGAAKILPFTDELLREVRSIPGVLSAAATTSLPVNPSRFTPALPEGQPQAPLSERPIFNLQQVTPAYAATLRVPIIRGREYTGRDDAKSPPVVMINQAAARRFFPGQDAVGRHILVGRIPTPSEIVAVLGDVRNQSLTQDVQPELYVPFAQIPSLNINLIVRTAGDPHRLAAAVRARVLKIDPDQPVTRLQTMDELLDIGAAQPRLTTYLLGGLSAAALILALIGIYGVISYSVAERTQEMGIRIALGAEPSEILSLVLRQGLTLAAIGIAIGLGASLALARLITSLLYQVSPTDPATYLIAPALFAAVALLASYLPARRATKVDPVIALRG